MRAVPLHSLDQGLGARVQGDAVFDHLIDHGFRQAFEQRDPLAQGGFKGDFAPHGALCDRRYMRLEPDEIGEFVNAFLADHGGIHVSHEQLLAPANCRLHHDIDFRTRERGANAVGELTLVCAGFRGKGDVGGDTMVQPERGRSAWEGGVRPRQDVIAEYGCCRIGDQGRNVSHAMSNRGKEGRADAVLIAGPTASGKSAVALELAERLNGVVINADSMQVYRDLRIITARPTPEEEKRVPHRLYGHVDAAENYSVGRWLGDVRNVLQEVRAAGRMPVLVGGTGLYFMALTTGLAAIPPIDPAIRAGLRARLEAEGVATLHAQLQCRDAESAGRIMPRDRSRILRALEVVEATGRTMSDWHREDMPALIAPERAIKIFLTPNREELKLRIEKRFDLMLEAGAVEEVRALDARNLPENLPAMKAHGVPWLRRHLRGEISLEAAAAGGKMDTRRYAKRQVTWFRNQMPDWLWVDPAAASDHLNAALAAVHPAT